MFSKKDKTNKSRQIEFQDFLCGTSTMDYIIQKEPYEEQIEKACAFIKEADAILVGAGAGASTAAGLSYSGKRFTENFGEFIKKYGTLYIRICIPPDFIRFPRKKRSGATGQSTRF